MNADWQIHFSWIPFGILLVWVLERHAFPFLVPELRQSSYAIMAFAGFAGIFLSVFIREIIRSFISVKLRMPVEEIVLHIFGGLIELEKDTGGKRVLLLSVIGLLASFFISAIIAWSLIAFVSTRTPLIITGAGFFLLVFNLVMALGNFLPAVLLSAGMVLLKK